MVVNSLYGVYLGMIGVVLPYIGQTFHRNSEVQGRLIAAGFLGAVASLLLCGMLSDYWGRKSVLLLSGAVCSLGMLLFGNAPLLLMALAVAPLIVGGLAGMQAGSSALAADLAPDRRAMILNATQIAFGGGAVVGPGAAHLLLEAGIGWRGIYIGLASIVLAVLGVLLLLPVPRSFGERDDVQEGDRLQQKGQKEGGLKSDVLRSLLRQPVFVGLCLAQMLYGGAEVGFFSWMPTYFQKVLPGGAPRAGQIVSIFWIAMTLGRLAMARLLGVWSNLRLGMALALGGASCALLTLAWNTPLLVMLFVGLTGLFFGGIYSTILVEAGERFPTLLGTVIGSIGTASCVGTATVPWAVGFLAGTPAGWRGGLLLIPCSAGLVALILWGMSRRT